jgi:hypothetical protein
MTDEKRPARDRHEDDDAAAREAAEPRDTADAADELHPNPPFTTTKRMTSPKFGSAGSGGLENEPGPERD